MPTAAVTMDPTLNLTPSVERVNTDTTASTTSKKIASQTNSAIKVTPETSKEMLVTNAMSFKPQSICINTKSSSVLTTTSQSFKNSSLKKSEALYVSVHTSVSSSSSLKDTYSPPEQSETLLTDNLDTATSLSTLTKVTVSVENSVIPRYFTKCYRFLEDVSLQPEVHLTDFKKV